MVSPRHFLIIFRRYFSGADYNLTKQMKNNYDISFMLDCFHKWDHFLHLPSGKQNSNGEVRGACPLCGASQNSRTAFLWNEQKQRFRCFACGAYGDAFELLALQEGKSKSDTLAYLIEYLDLHKDKDADAIQRIGADTERRRKQRKREQQEIAAQEEADREERRARAREIYCSTEEIPDGNETLHPAHLWAIRFGIWQEDLSWPVNVRLRCTEQGHSLVTALCKPDGWDYATGWPLSRESIEAVHLVHINKDGSPREVRIGNTTTNKQSIGLMSNCFSLISGSKSGKNISQEGIISVCEGLKDALAIYSETGHTVLTWIGLHGYRNPDIAEYLALRKERIIIWPDGDKAGREAALELREALRHKENGNVEILSLPDGYDPAEFITSSITTNTKTKEYNEKYSRKHYTHHSPCA